MNKPVMFASAIVTALVLTGVALLAVDRKEMETAASGPGNSGSANEEQRAFVPVARELERPTLVAQSTDESSVSNESGAESSYEDERSEDPAKMFRADAAGSLVLQERTRLNIEKLSALYTPDELRQRLAVIEQTLPASAYQKLIELMDRYRNFVLAARQALPPSHAPSTVEEAIAQYEQLHALREAHFGPDATEAMFGKEERINRQLLEFMSLEQHEGLTMEEKVIKAQEMLSNSPELLTAYEKNRTAPPSSN